MTINTSPTWLTLRDACKQLGVSPATLRQWADAGKIESFRTPGGHRRFRIAALSTAPPVAPAPNRQIETLIHSALGRARLEIAAGKLEQEKWHTAFSPSAIEEHRQLGHRLLALLIQVLRNEAKPNTWTKQAHRIGKEYARVSIQRGTSLVNILRAYLFFRDFIFEELFGISVSVNAAGIDAVEMYRRLNQITNILLIEIVEAYMREKKH